jgi:cytosine deaminase
VALVALPTTNLHLQDRAAGRAPRLRGIAPLLEAQAAGMTVMLASDNVGDAFYPYGEYDPLAALRLAVPACHLAPADWLDSIGLVPARWRGGAVAPLMAGSPADFIWHDAADAGALVARPRAARIVYRGGRPPASHGLDERTP